MQLMFREITLERTELSPLHASKVLGSQEMNL